MHYNGLRPNTAEGNRVRKTAWFGVRLSTQYTIPVCCRNIMLQQALSRHRYHRVNYAELGRVSKHRLHGWSPETRANTLAIGMTSKGLQLSPACSRAGALPKNQLVYIQCGHSIPQSISE
jgi:hypothetical protein